MGPKFGHITMQSNHVLRMFVHQSIVTHAHNIPVAIVKMADGGKRFNPVCFNGKRLLEFSNLRPKDKSKVRKKAYDVRRGVFTAIGPRICQMIVEFKTLFNCGSRSMIDGGEVYMWIMDLREQPLWNAGEVVSEDQATCLDQNFVTFCGFISS